MATNPYSYGSLGQRWTVGEPTSKSLLDVSRVKADANRWALEQLIVDPDDTANFVLTAPGLNIDSNTLYVDSVNNSVGFGLTNPNDYAFNGTPSWVASGGAGNASVIVVSGTTSSGYLAFADGTTGTDRYTGQIQYNHSTNTMSFKTGGGVEAMTINSAQDLAVDTDSLFVDASTDSIGYGTSSPTTFAGYTTLHHKNASGDVVQLAENDNGVIHQIIASGTDTVLIGSRSNHNLKIGTNDTARLTIDTSGNMGLGGTAVSNGTGSTVFNVNSTTGGATIHLTNNTTGTTNSDGALFVQSGSDLLLINRESGAMHLRTADVNRITILSGGDVGLGTQSPEIRLSVTDTYNGSALTSNDIPAVQIINEQGSYTADNVLGVLGFGKSQGFASGVRAGMVAYYSGTGSQSSNVGAYLSFRTSADAAGDSTERARIDSSGNLLIGYTSSNGSYKLQVNSQIFATNATIATSDGRYKEDVQTLSNATDLVSRLNPVQFKWKAHEIHNLDVGKTDVGFIAQEVQAVLSDTDYSDSVVVTNKTDDEEYLGLGETKLIPLLTAALQEAITKIETLETKVAALEAA